VANERRLNKDESRERFRELRTLWNQYDPIGVMANADDHLDEYEAYVGPLMRLLEQGVGEEDIAVYLKGIVTERMGMTWNSYLDNSTHVFVTRCHEWFKSKWMGTVS
jgi:hypothetical protein